MASELLDIQPQELRFLFELKKMSSCNIRLVNKFNGYVAFKVKTTSPKKYCVRPNVGILKPESFRDFTVTMQAPKQEPPGMVCKDKFLVQSTVVPAGTTDDDVTSKMFVRVDGRYIDEVKLRVVLLSPPNSPTLSLTNAILKQDPLHEASTLKDSVILKHESFTQNRQISDSFVLYPTISNDVVENKLSDTKVVKPAKNIDYNALKEVGTIAGYAPYELMKELEDPLKNAVYKTVKGAEEPSKNGDYKIVDHLGHAEDLTTNVDYKSLNQVKDELKLMKDVEEMKSKLLLLESKMTEAQITISKLTEERMGTGQERESLRHELVLLRRKRGDGKVQVGFPFLFVCMVTLVAVLLGYTLRCGS